jgi:hypothetical protein
MSWLTLLSTALGAAIGIVSTLVADRARFRRELIKVDRDARRQLYAEFLTADAAAHDTMRLQAFTAHGSGERRLAVHEAFSNSQLYSTRYRMTVLAPASVVRDSEDTFRRLRRIRRVLSEGHGVESDTYIALHQEHEAALRSLRNSMREDLGTGALLYTDAAVGELAPEGER